MNKCKLCGVSNRYSMICHSCCADTLILPKLHDNAQDISRFTVLIRVNELSSKEPCYADRL